MHSICRFLIVVVVIRARPLLVVGLLAAVLTGCRTVPPAPPINLSEPGWVIRQGQAVWRPKPRESDVAGDLLVAMHRDGRSVVQFTKPPLPLAAAQRETNSWRVQFFAQNKVYAGRGEPPSRIVWFQLPDGLIGRHSDTNWFLARKPAGRWHLENLVTEEMLDGFLATTSLPKTHVVQSADSLPRVARWYGVTVDAIRAVNPGRESNWFRLGHELVLPAPASAAMPSP
jgi:hypothetical protein